MEDFFKDIVIPGLALIVSIFSIFYSSKASEKAEQANKTANRISNGQIELTIASMIRETETRVIDISILLAKFFKNSLTEEEQKEFEILTLAHEQAVEANLNAYEEACAKYIDAKVDKERFKRMYNTPIRRLVESEDLNRYFPPHNPPYRCILKVHDEWHNLER